MRASTPHSDLLRLVHSELADSPGMCTQNMAGIKRSSGSSILLPKTNRKYSQLKLRDLSVVVRIFLSLSFI